MANNVIQVKRTNVSGRQPNTTGSYSTNSQYISAGEFAFNMADGILYTSNGSAAIPVGANNINVNVTGNASIKAIVANGSIGSSGQILASNGSGLYWTSSGGGGSGTVTEVDTGNGLTGGPITSSGTISVLANTGIVSNSSGVFVDPTYVGTQTANNTNFVGTISAANVVSNAQLQANLLNYTPNSTVYSTFAQNTSVYSTFATNTYVNNTFATNTYVNSTFATNTYVNSTFATNTYVNNTFAPLAGATFTGQVNVNANLTVNNNLVVNQLATFNSNVTVDASGSATIVVGNSTVNTTVNSSLIVANNIFLRPQVGVAANTSEGSVFYDSVNHALNVYTDDPSTPQEIGQQQYLRVVNKSGTALTFGQAVYINGAQGNRPSVNLAIANSINTYDVVGLVSSSSGITNNAEGFIIINGLIQGYDTRSFTAGSVLYLSPSVPGGLTTTPPSYPNYNIVVGQSLNSTVNGKIYLSIVRNYLAGIPNTAVSISNGTVITYSNNFTFDYANSVLTVGNSTVYNTMGYVNAAGSFSYFQIVSNVNNSVEVSAVNSNTGNNSSTDYIAYDSYGVNGTNYIDLGINGNGYNQFTWTINGPSDGYLYTGNSNLSIGTNLSTGYLNFFTGGTLANNERLRITNTYINVNTGLTLNSPAFTVGSSFVANTTGVYSAGTVNAASYTIGTAFIANSSGISTTNATFTGTTIANNLTVSGNLTLTGNTVIVGSNNLIVQDSVISVHTQANLAPWTTNDGLNIGLALHYYDTQDKQGFLGRENSTGRLVWYDTSTDVSGGSVSGNTLGTMQANQFWVGNGSVYTIVNSTAFTGTANNSTYLGGVSSGSYVNTSGSYTLTGVHTHNANVIFGSAAGLIANGTIGTAGQILATNGTTVYWTTDQTSGNVTSNNITSNVVTTNALNANHVVVNNDLAVVNGTYSNVSMYSDRIFIGNSVVNATINSTVYTGTANNANYLGGVAAASYVNTSGAYTITGVHTYNANIIIGTTAGLRANGSFGTAGQVLATNGSTVYWTTDQAAGNITATYITSNTLNANHVVVNNDLAVVNGTYSNVSMYSDRIFIGNSAVNTTINSTAFSGTSNNTLYVGSTPASNVVTNTYLVTNYTTNSTVYSTFAQNTSVYSTFAQNTAVYSTFAQNTTVVSTYATNTYVNSTFAPLAGAAFTGNVSLSTPLIANGGSGTGGQVLTSNGTTGAPYWSTVSGGGVNTASQYTWSNTQTFSNTVTHSGNLVIGNTASLTANGSTGTTGQALLSNGSGVYWGPSPTGNAVSQTFTGNGSATSFTLSNAVRSQNNSIVTLDGVVQIPVTHYTISSTNLTFTSAPIANTNIEVRNFDAIIGTSISVSTGKAIAMAIVFGG